MTAQSLKTILAEWQADNSKGSRANLTSAYLTVAYLELAYRRDVDLRDPNLWGMNRWDANLERVDLTGDDLRNADLRGRRSGTRLSYDYRNGHMKDQTDDYRTHTRPLDQR